nr:signal peptidase I [Blautia sp. MSJ-19]
MILGLALGLTLYFTNAQKILGNQLPMPFGIGIANVLSGSMEPTFSKGSLLIIKETQEIKKGDIVVYQSGNSLVVHRVIEIQKDQITTQGDANNTSDPVFNRSEIRGTVIAWIPYLGTMLSLVRTPVGVIILLLLAFLLIEGSFRRQKDEDEQELEAIKEEIRRLKQESDKQGKDNIEDKY